MIEANGPVQIAHLYQIDRNKPNEHKKHKFRNCNKANESNGSVQIFHLYQCSNWDKWNRNKPNEHKKHKFRNCNKANESNKAV